MVLDVICYSMKHIWSCKYRYICIGCYLKTWARLCICSDSFRIFAVAWATCTNLNVYQKRLFLAWLYCMFATLFLPYTCINVVSSWALLPIGVFKYFIYLSIPEHIRPCNTDWMVNYITVIRRNRQSFQTFVLFLSWACCAFLCVCLYVHFGHLLGKGWPLGSSLWCITVSLSLSHWYPRSGVVLDCIDSWSLHPYLLFSNSLSRQTVAFI